MRTRNIILAAAGAVAVGYVINRILQSRRDTPVFTDEQKDDKEVDTYIDDSFPASDPPSWSPGGSFH
ncbi:hypothetical protein B9G69_010030 [Bdellovibrio sp. SKB1291214]|uniref:hypothetical protein n=1 Tax=Bdellovibrio sp. SKB1291214 TaxID=1732569 RepID=UPI000B518C85|nr:hypothetical protein [Bdellovibrio sp. SKB1291214]UYL07383.1 hypothetical protein B9G69_010030 [Bdellovibrio sp. SKB1291214]